MSDSSIVVPPANKRLTRLKAGLAIGFGLPFSLGIAYQLCALFGWSVDFSGVRLIVELGVLGALLVLTLQYERLPLGSLGVHKIRAQEIYFGLAAGLAIVALSAAVAELIPHRGAAGSGEFESLVRAIAPADFSALSQAPIWLALLVLIASALAEEVAARGYAIRRLRVISGTTVLAAAAALALDMLARIPLWGLRYTLVILPAEVVLVALYLWRRQLVTVVVAHLMLTLTILLAIYFVGTQAVARNATSGETANADLGEEMAVVELRRALGQSTGPGSAAAQRAQADFLKHDYPHALQQIGDALRLEPKTRAYLIVRSNIHAAQGETYLVIEDINQMIANDPKDSEAYLARGSQYKGLRDYQHAAADIETAIKLAPNDARNFAERSSLHFWQQQYPAAIEDMSTAIALEPTNRDFLIRRAFIYDHIGQNSRALKDCDQVVTMDPSKPEGYVCRATSYAQSGDLKGAIASLDQAIKQAPDSAALYSTRAKAEMSAGLWLPAHLDFEKIASLNPDNPDICDGAAWSLATSAHDEVRDGKAALALAIHENELTRYSRWRYLDTLAAAYAETGDTASAVKWEEAALTASDATNPDDLEWMHGLLKVFREGRAWRETATTAYSTRPRAAILIGVIIVFALAAVGLVALLYWSARWSLHRARRARPVTAA